MRGVSDRGEAALSERPPDKQPETGIVILYHGRHKNECRTIRSGDLGMNQDSILRYSSGCRERTRRRLGHRLPDVPRRPGHAGTYSAWPGTSTGSLASRIGSREPDWARAADVPRKESFAGESGGARRAVGVSVSVLAHFRPFLTVRPGLEALARQAQQNGWESPQTPPCSWKVGAMSGVLAALTAGTSRGTIAQPAAHVGPSSCACKKARRKASAATWDSRVPGQYPVSAFMPPQTQASRPRIRRNSLT